MSHARSRSRTRGDRLSPHSLALQKEIQRAGAVTGLIRSVLGFGRIAAIGAVLSGIGSGVVLLTLGASMGFGPDAIRAGMLAVFALGVVCTLAAKMAVPAAAAYRRLRREQLRRKLSTLSREQLAEILLPLKEYPYSDTRHIVRPLIHDLRPEGREIAPASAPGGTGSEVAPRDAN